MRGAATIFLGSLVLLAGLASGSATGRPPLPVSCDSAGPSGTRYVPGLNCRTVVVDGYLRRYLVYVPTNAAVRIGRPLPLVFMFHGSGGDGGGTFLSSGWREKADQVGLVAVFPTALPYVLSTGRLVTKWHAFGLESDVDVASRPPGYPAASPWPADDVKFTRTMLGDVQRRLKIDRKRVYVSGFSNGAGFCLRLAVELSHRFAAAGCHAGVLDQDRSAQLKARIPVLQTYGSRDETILRRLGLPPGSELPLDAAGLLAVKPLATIIGYHLATFDLGSRYAETRGTNLLKLTYRTPLRGNTSGNVYVFEVLAGLPHRYPTVRNNPFGFVAADMFWTFFRQHPRR